MNVENARDGFKNPLFSMTVDDLREFYGTQAAAADAIDVSRQAVSLWIEKGIPIEFQLKWEVASGGKVRADLPAIVRESAA